LINEHGDVQKPKCERCRSGSKSKPCIIWKDEESPSGKCSWCVRQGHICSLDYRIVAKSSELVEDEDEEGEAEEPEDMDIESPEAEGHKSDSEPEMIAHLPRRPKREGAEYEASEASSSKRARLGLLSQLKLKSEGPNLIEVLKRIEGLEEKMTEKLEHMGRIERRIRTQADRMERLIDRLDNALQ